jgi:predicted DNA-binding transcriptional regulator YafY
METATRLLQLLALLHARPFWTGQELAERLEVTPRTIRRDVARLRALDHPVEAVPGRHGGYQLGRGNELPPLVLDDREALAVVLGLREASAGVGDGLEEAAVSALAKLERVLPSRLRERLQDVQAATLTISGRPTAPTDPDHLVVLAQACRRRERVRFPYTARDGQKSFRHVEPLRLVHISRRWYLVAYDLEREDWRTFRIDRAASPIATGQRCLPREEPDPEELVRAGLSLSPYDVQATVRLHVPYDEVVQHLSPSMGLLEPDGAATRLKTGGNDADGVARWLAMLPYRLEVLEPAAVRDALHDHARALLQA